MSDTKKAEKIHKMFEPFSSNVHFQIMELASRRYATAQFSTGFLNSSLFKRLGASDAYTHELNYSPTIHGYFVDILNIYVGVELPAAYDPQIHEKELSLRYGIRVVTVGMRGHIALVKTNLGNDFTANQLYRETLRAQELIDLAF